MKWIAENTSPDEVLVSIMNQYTPFDFVPEKFLELKRRVTKMEYNSVVNYAAELGINGFTQEKSSASEKYVPDFDLTGIR
ncbi:MAG TPA: radical SAM protein, partial [Ruminococcus sp.]|nr:radical SAM protein [Ruminococcus sp.]